MTHILVLLPAAVTGVVSYYLMRKSAALLPLLRKETAAESQRFIEYFRRYHLIIATLGVLAVIFNRPLLLIGFTFSVLLLSTLFSLAFAKKISQETMNLKRSGQECLTPRNKKEFPKIVL